jgi:hypothetical protein
LLAVPAHQGGRRGPDVAMARVLVAVDRGTEGPTHDGVYRAYLAERLAGAPNSASRYASEGRRFQTDIAPAIGPLPPNADTEYRREWHRVNDRQDAFQCYVRHRPRRVTRDGPSDPRWGRRIDATRICIRRQVSIRTLLARGHMDRRTEPHREVQTRTGDAPAWSVGVRRAFGEPVRLFSLRKA